MTCSALISYVVQLVRSVGNPPPLYRRRLRRVTARILARLDHDERGQRRVDHVALVLLRVFVWRIFVRIFGVFSASLDTDEAMRAF